MSIEFGLKLSRIMQGTRFGSTGSTPKRRHAAISDGELIREVQGDLFSCPEKWSLAHCISEDCRMGKGIAVQFKKRFGGVQELLKQNKRIGNVAVLPMMSTRSAGVAVDGPSYVYYLITKEKYWQKPTYGSLRQSLLATRDHCISHGVRQLAMPKIGCGLDGLNWNEVRNIVCDVFADSGVQITVYSFKA